MFTFQTHILWTYTNGTQLALQYSFINRTYYVRAPGFKEVIHHKQPDTEFSIYTDIYVGLKPSRSHHRFSLLNLFAEGIWRPLGRIYVEHPITTTVVRARVSSDVIVYNRDIRGNIEVIGRRPCRPLIYFFQRVKPAPGLNSMFQRVDKLYPYDHSDNLTLDSLEPEFLSDVLAQN